MRIEKKNIEDLKPAPYNARQSTKKQEQQLSKSLKKFGVVEPIIFNERSGFIVGGHFRVRELSKLGYKDVECVIVDLKEEDERELNIRLNANTGEWDWDELANKWDEEKLNEWGLDVPNVQETGKISDIEFKDIYYQPKELPHVKLEDCIDTSLFDAKVEAIENSDIDEEKKEILKMFAYRFLRIDFEMVANYYYFNAKDDEKAVIERLRLVLSDSGIDGFIEDDLLRIHKMIEGWNEG